MLRGLSPLAWFETQFVEYGVVVEAFYQRWFPCAWLFLSVIIIGSIIVFFFIQAAQDPNAAIEINGVPTKDFTAKVGAIIFTALFPLFGIFLSFAPSNLLEKWTTKIILLISNKA